jgi:hypothetical protein
MRTHVSTDAQTQSIPRVPALVVAVTDARVAAPAPPAEVAAAETDTEAAAPAPGAELAVPEPEPEVAAPEASTEIPCEESVEHIYEAGLARLEALHDRWAAAMAEIRQAPASGEPGEAAA